MAKQQSTRRLRGVIDQVREACNFVINVATEAGLSEDGIFQCQLSVEEIFTNIVEHGYQYAGGDKTIEIVCEWSDEALLIAIIDEAPPYDPLGSQEPDPDTPLWEREDGGWGVFFVKQYMDDIHYRLLNDRNHLFLKKKIG